jgi:hypothetical protein
MEKLRGNLVAFTCAYVVDPGKGVEQLQAHGAFTVGAPQNNYWRIRGLLQLLRYSQAGAGLVKGGGKTDDPGAVLLNLPHTVVNKQLPVAAGLQNLWDKLGDARVRLEKPRKVLTLSREPAWKNQIREKPLTRKVLGRRHGREQFLVCGALRKPAIDARSDSLGKVQIEITDQGRDAMPLKMRVEQADSQGGAPRVRKRENRKKNIH